MKAGMSYYNRKKTVCLLKRFIQSIFCKAHEVLEAEIQRVEASQKGDRTHTHRKLKLTTVFIPENGWLADEISFWGGAIFRGHVSFRECDGLQLLAAA